jgi:hypothetical protein
VKFNKVYIPQDALTKHEDFDTWYEDGEVFLKFQSKDGWKEEKNPVQIIGRMGGQVGTIKPDHRVLNYYIQYERYEYIMHSYVIEDHYYIEGMLWDLYGSYNNPPFDIVAETLTSYDKKDVHVKLVNFKGHGPCLEVHVPDLSKLRIAVACVIAIGLKEEWKGKSEGEDYRAASMLERIKGRIFENKGFTYEQIKQLKAENSPLTHIVKPQGRPCDNN